MSRPQKYTEYIEMIVALAPGAAVSFTLPTGAYDCRERYRRLAGIAHRTLGVGNYRLTVNPDTNQMTVARVSGKRAMLFARQDTA